MRAISPGWSYCRCSRVQGRGRTITASRSEGAPGIRPGTDGGAAMASDPIAAAPRIFTLCRVVMSHSDAPPRLTLGDRRRNVIQSVLRRAIDLAATAAVGGFGLAAPAAAYASAQPAAVTVYTM